MDVHLKYGHNIGSFNIEGFFLLQQELCYLKDMNDSSFHLEATRRLTGYAVITTFSWVPEDKWPH